MSVGVVALILRGPLPNDPMLPNMTDGGVPAPGARAADCSGDSRNVTIPPGRHREHDRDAGAVEC